MEEDAIIPITNSLVSERISYEKRTTTKKKRFPFLNTRSKRECLVKLNLLVDVKKHRVDYEFSLFATVNCFNFWFHLISGVYAKGWCWRRKKKKLNVIWDSGCGKSSSFANHSRKHKTRLSYVDFMRCSAFVEFIFLPKINYEWRCMFHVNTLAAAQINFFSRSLRIYDISVLIVVHGMFSS